MDYEFLQHEWLDNTVLQYIRFGGILIAGALFRKLISKILSRILFRFVKRFSEDVGEDKFVALLIRPLIVFISFLTLYLAFIQLQWPPQWQLSSIENFGLKMVLWRGFLAAVVFSCTWIATRVLDFFALVFLHRAYKTESRLDNQLVPFARDILKLIIFIMSVMFILSTIFNVNIATLIAGLGLGGLAVALAAKESLENLLASFTIFLDKPFVIGDLVQVGGVTGKVESIGFRSTRIRTAEKSFVTVPNKKMIDAELENQSERFVRRAYFTIGLTYAASNEQIKKIISGIKQALDVHRMIEKESVVRFIDFGPNSLNILVQYYVLSNEWEEFVRIREEVNFLIMEIVQGNGAVFAFPPMGVLAETQEAK